MTRFPRIRRALRVTPSVPAAIAIIVLCALTGAALRWSISTLAPTLLFVTFHPLVLICTLLAGWRAGAVCAVISGLLAVAFFTPDNAPGLFTAPGELGGFVAFLLADSVIIATGNSLRNTVRALDDAVHLSDKLNQELQHRVGNSLAVVQAVARQSARGRTTQEFLPVFEERMQALARASRYLGAGPGLVCDVRKLVEEGCSAFLGAGNIAMDGPDCRVSTDSCIPLVMALHELCTNAVKHGALSVPEGRVQVSWRMAEGGRQVLLTWQEAGGPPVTAPKRRGLGSAVLRAQSGLAAVDLAYDPAGLRCTILIDGAATAH
ncbi:sensor histidine kinase [Alteraurantiacibacter buctensis]|uniref:histidine kinase n=1 Tax=Alteraurantiacibacter buctensis TaxID=1503981 RepID=A0A844YTU0_9SPHN|nr:HWE histidine kinase domain-containing protein [Alteraurantiacibacter buctensis]MXO71735.1 DUF4118 domain-containing protein [Alteraurantiacibacter buctensis]